jgi:hypothetical protein
LRKEREYQSIRKRLDIIMDLPQHKVMTMLKGSWRKLQSELGPFLFSEERDECVEAK